MDETEKLLRKRNQKDRDRILKTLKAIREGVLDGLQVKKLSGSALYRVRVGDFRIQFSINPETKKTVIESVRLRNESTYQ